MRSRAPVLAAALLPVILAAGAANEANAQDGFLFRSPAAHLTLRAGGVAHRAQSDVFDFITTELTLDRGDFRAPSIGADLSVFLHPKIDMTFGIAWSEAERQSEFRDYVEETPQGDVPISQVTTLRTTPVTVSARYYPWSRGESVSSLAWVPAATTPYVGLGGGMTWYRLRQVGDFVQESDLAIFTDDYSSSGSAITGHVMAGVDHWFTAKVGLNFEARYAIGNADLNDDFSRWDGIDLSGLQAGLGLSLRW